MIKFINGPKGSGKTKKLIEMANEDVKAGNGNIVFIDVDDDHIFSLSHSVRLINATKFNINSIESFYGFLCGIISMDYDLEKVYIDGIYKIINIDKKSLENLGNALKDIGEKFNTQIFIGLDYTMECIPESLRQYAVELNKK